MDILLIEDDLRMAELISIGLRDNGHSVRLATDGIDGYMQYIATHPDMIITDIMLPGTNGIDLCKKIKEQEKIAQVLTLADQEIDLYKEQLDKLKLEKKSLMQQLLTGQKRVKLNNQKTA